MVPSPRRLPHSISTIQPVQKSRASSPYASGQGRLGSDWGDLKPFCSNKPKYDQADFLDPWPDFNSNDPAVKKAYFDDFEEVKLKGAAVPPFVFDNAKKPFRRRERWMKR